MIRSLSYVHLLLLSYLAKYRTIAISSASGRTTEPTYIRTRRRPEPAVGQNPPSPVGLPSRDDGVPTDSCSYCFLFSELLGLARRSYISFLGTALCEGAGHQQRIEPGDNGRFCQEPRHRVMDILFGGHGAHSLQNVRNLPCDSSTGTCLSSCRAPWTISVSIVLTPQRTLVQRRHSTATAVAWAAESAAAADPTVH